MVSFHSTNLVLIISLLVTTQSAAFLETRALSGGSRSFSSDNFSCPTFLSALVPSTESDVTKNNDELSWDVHMIDDIIDLCEQGKVLDATKLLTNAENSEKLTTESDYLKIFKALSRISNSHSANMANGLIDHMTENSENANGCRPTAESYNAAISVWASSNRRDSATRCCEYLNTLWSLYDETSDTKYVPLRSSYIHTIDALARSRQGYQGAKQAESLLDDMEVMRHEHPSLSPNTMCFNAVLNALSKSGVLRGSAERSEELLNRMISLCKKDGRKELIPDTTSFNTVIHTLAKSKEKNREIRAEALLELMNQLSSEGSDLGSKCKPDQVSFNTVLDCWAWSQTRGSARRATSILQHMEQRYAAKKSDFHPDITSYTTVINAWSRSREKDAPAKAEEVLRWSEEAHREGIPDVKPNTLTYNSLINCYSKSNQRNASSRAETALDLMKKLALESENEDCRPDVVTYTSVIDTIAKQSSLEASEKAELLLEELETAYRESLDPRMKPNIRTYTSVINAIARSRMKPQRAEAILNKIQMSFEAEYREPKPDVVSFNALINAYGWSFEKGKAVKCFAILERMIALGQSRKNPAAKPDIITCNSILNACAYSEASSESERAELMDIVVQTYEIFQTAAPSYGNPDQITYAQVLLAISKLMEPDEYRFNLAKTTFWQCCKNGHLNPLVVTNLHLALDWSNFADVMGPSLKSKEGEKIRYDLFRLPLEWTKNAPPPFRKHTRSQPSRKRDQRFQITKSVLSKAKKQKSSEAI